MLLFSCFLIGCPDEDNPTSPQPVFYELEDTWWLVDHSFPDSTARMLRGDIVMTIDEDSVYWTKYPFEYWTAYPCTAYADTFSVISNYVQAWGGWELAPKYPFHAGSQFLEITDPDDHMFWISNRDNPPQMEPGQVVIFERNTNNLELPDAITDEIISFVEQNWSATPYLHAEYAAAIDSETGDAGGEAYLGSFDSWIATEWMDKADNYLPEHFSLNIQDEKTDDFYRNLILSPEQSGFGWTDWAEFYSDAEIGAIATDNGYFWPGRSFLYEELVNMLEVSWTYPDP
jgi:hypothetical protein